jgi:NTP pyrophosphatase (non-canonical NTP hydrolase)
LKLCYNLDDLVPSIIAFRRERDWEHFHRPKELTSALSIEVSELQELFLWKEGETHYEVRADNERLDKIREELADIMIYLIYLIHDLNINLKEAIMEKLELNRRKYPVEDYRGIAKKSIK